MRGARIKIKGKSKSKKMRESILISELKLSNLLWTVRVRGSMAAEKRTRFSEGPEKPAGGGGGEGVTGDEAAEFFERNKAAMPEAQLNTVQAAAAPRKTAYLHIQRGR